MPIINSQLQRIKHLDPKRRVLITAAAATFFTGGSYALYAHYKLINRQKQAQIKYESISTSGINSELRSKKNQTKSLKKRRDKNGRNSLNAIWGFLLAAMGRHGWKKLICLATMAVIRTFLSNRLARVQGQLFRAVFLRRAPLFTRLIAENLILCLLQSALHSSTRFVTGLLSLQFRKLITHRIHSDYFRNMSYYKVSHVDKRIHNPEQCITSDVPRFSREMSELVQENISACFDAVLYTWRLSTYASPKYAAWILAYVLGSGFLTRSISPPFGKMLSKEQRLEGDYKKIHSRLRTHSESIAFYGGQEKEGGIVRKRFDDVIKHLSKVIHTQWWFGTVQDFTQKYLGATIAVVLILEPFFSGHLKPENSTSGRAKMLANMRYHTNVIITLFQSLSVLASCPRRLLRMSGYAGRIGELMQVSQELGKTGTGCSKPSSTLTNAGQYFEQANYIEFKDLKIVTPSGKTLVDNLTLKLERGKNLLITGPNGSGKSSLFRVLGGLWPLVAGSISKPSVGASLNNEIFYVPQRPYTAIGTLRDQLIYPLTSDEETEPLDEHSMRELLRDVDLEYLLDRYPSDMEVNWGDELSLGEQQRLGMARLFYHRPSFAILDECTSAVTTDMEERFCAKVRAMGTSCITISHRPALVDFHDIVLVLDGEGSFSLHYKDVTDADEADCKSPVISVNGDQNSAAVNDNSCYVDTIIDQSDTGSMNGITGEKVMIRRLKASPRSIKLRAAALSNILVPRLCSKQGGQMALVAMLIAARTWISDQIAALNGTSVKYVVEQNKSAFMCLIGISVLQSAASAITAQSLRYLTAMLALGWRMRMTNHLLSLYFKNNAYYKVFHLSEKKVDADQRLTEDVERLSHDMSSLVTSMVKPVVDVLWFSWRMKRLTGNRGIGILYAYMLFGLGFLRAITPNFGSMTSQEQQLEGIFRYMHSRLCTHAESIAFFGGGLHEQAMIEAKFNALIDHSKWLLMKRWIFGIVNGFITKELPHNVAWGLSLLYAMDNHKDSASSSVQGDMAHALRFLASVVSQSFLAFGDLLELYKKFNELSGGVNRIMELEELLNSAQQDDNDDHIDRAMHSGDEDEIIFSDVDIVTPGQKLLARKVNFRISPGKGLLVTGPNGVGKSSLFRVLGELWPTANGRISKPLSNKLSIGLSREIFYVPQRPYSALGTLRDQIIYPLALHEAIMKVSQDNQSDGCNGLDLLEHKLHSILQEVRLENLLAREGGWDAVVDWENVLSLGEQQRLGMARLFFHRPKYGILDECTNATSVDVEEHLYNLATSLGITIVTISQRPALVPFHSMELKLVDGEGDWELRVIKPNI